MRGVLSSMKRAGQVGLVMHGVLSSSKRAGQVGFVMCNMKLASEARVGDTIVDDAATAPLPGFKVPRHARARLLS